MRAHLWLIVASVAGCATEPTTTEDPVPLPIDEVWAKAIHPGDVVVLVPGTGAFDLLAEPIEALPGDAPVVDVRKNDKVANDAIVFEQAIAAAHRAGISNADLESGALPFALWGAGFTRLTHWTYVSWEGIRIPIQVIGGRHSCAHGLVLENLANYSLPHLDADAHDLYKRTQTWLADHPAANVIIASHSWGGAIAEYEAFELATIRAKLGPFPAAEPIAFTIAMGVPGLIPSYAFAGPTFRSLDEGALYEVDRPDDPVHAMNPSGNPDGHQYDILFGDDFQGSYGITTDQLSCRDVPGACR